MRLKMFSSRNQQMLSVNVIITMDGNDNSIKHLVFFNATNVFLSEL